MEETSGHQTYRRRAVRCGRIVGDEARGQRHVERDDVAGRDDVTNSAATVYNISGIGMQQYAVTVADQLLMSFDARRSIHDAARTCRRIRRVAIVFAIKITLTSLELPKILVRAAVW